MYYHGVQTGLINENMINRILYNTERRRTLGATQHYKS